MEAINEIKRPSKNEQKVAQNSYAALIAAIEQLTGEETEIEIEETKDKIIIPVRALNFLGNILKGMSQGKIISIVPLATEVTTQKAAEILGCSRPFLVKLLEEGKINFTKIGKHRRIRIEDVLNFKQKMKEQQKQHIIDIMSDDEELGLYDSCSIYCNAGYKCNLFGSA
jgi:excisionase family DNA binding protein